MIVHLGELARWLNERMENCRRIGATKDNLEAIGWYDDARHFQAAIAVVDWASDHHCPHDICDETRPPPSLGDPS